METKKRLIDGNLLIRDIDADPYRTESEKSYDRYLVHRQPTVDALLIRCHIGDPVFVVGTKCLSGLYEEECDTYIHYGECDGCHLDKEYMVFQRKVDKALFLYLHDLDENSLFRWGETVFKTQEEAEAALAKMKEADHETEP